MDKYTLRTLRSSALLYLAFTAIIFAFFVLTGCKPPPNPTLDTFAGRVIDCAKDEARKASFKALEEVSGLLLDFAPSEKEWRDEAQSRLTTLVTKYGIDGVACILGLRQEEYLAGSLSNPSDGIAKSGAERAGYSLGLLDVSVRNVK